MAARSVLLLLLPLLIPASLRGQRTDIQTFFDLLAVDPEQEAIVEQAILDGWNDSHAAMLVELHRFAQRRDPRTAEALDIWAARYDISRY